MKRLYIDDFFISGLRYYDAIMVWEQLKIGTRLRLEQEPNNPHDEWAVAIYLGEYHLGYIPRRSNGFIARLLRQGYDDLFEIYINQICPDEDPNQQISVVLYLLPKEGE